MRRSTVKFLLRRSYRERKNGAIERRLLPPPLPATRGQAWRNAAQWRIRP